MSARSVEQIVLETPRTVLRVFDDADFEALCRLHFDPAVMRYLVGGVRASEEAVRRDLDGYIEHQRSRGYGKWAVVDKETRELMGRAGLVDIEATGEVDVGYALFDRFWGKRLGTELATAIVGWAGLHIPSARLVGLVHPDNHASAKVLERLGFRYRENAKYFGAMLDVYRR